MSIPTLLGSEKTGLWLLSLQDSSPDESPISLVPTGNGPGSTGVLQVASRTAVPDTGDWRAVLGHRDPCLRADESLTALWPSFTQKPSLFTSEVTCYKELDLR